MVGKPVSHIIKKVNYLHIFVLDFAANHLKKIKDEPNMTK